MLSFEAPEKNPLPDHKGINALVSEKGKRVKTDLNQVNTPLTWVWRELVKNKMLQEGSTDKKNKERYCEYHDEEDHEIQHCEDFRQIIQSLMDDGDIEFFEEICEQRE